MKGVRSTVNANTSLDAATPEAPLFCVEFISKPKRYSNPSLSLDLSMLMSGNGRVCGFETRSPISKGCHEVAPTDRAATFQLKEIEYGGAEIASYGAVSTTSGIWCSKTDPASPPSPKGLSTLSENGVFGWPHHALSRAAHQRVSSHQIQQLGTRGIPKPHRPLRLLQTVRMQEAGCRLHHYYQKATRTTSEGQK